MENRLNPVEERILGCLVKKEMATPDHYPLTLNALVNACNQKSNRHPFMQLETADVVAGLEALRMQHGLAVEVFAAGSRVPKYRHNIQAHWLFSPAKMAILAELLLRGPQTPGDLRARASRLHPLADAREVEEILEGLESRTDGPFVLHLPREPGRRERRWAQLFGEEPVPDEHPERPPTARIPPEHTPGGDPALQAIVEAQGREIEALKARIEALEELL